MRKYKYLGIIISGLFYFLGLMAQNKADTLNYVPLTFEIYLQEVAESNLQLLAEKKQINLAEAEVIAAKVLPDPELSFEGANETYSLELSYPLDIGNKRRARVRMAQGEVDKTQLEWDYFFQHLRAEAAFAFVDALVERELLLVKESSFQNMYQLSLSDSIRFTLGEITKNDVRQSKLESTLLQNELYQQEADLKSALVVLNQYMGKSSEDLHYPLGSWDSVNVDYKLSELLFIALEQRKDLKSVAKSMELAQQMLKLIRAERRLDVGLMIGYERDWKGPFPTGNSIKAGVSIPLKFSNFNKGSVKAKRIAVERSQYDIKQAQLQVEVEVTQGYYQYEAAQKRLKKYQSGMLDESKKVLDGIIYKYQRGDTSILEVLMAQRSYNEVQEHYIGVMKEYGYALIQLQLICGIWTLNF